MTVKTINTLNDYTHYYDNVEKLEYYKQKHGTSCECPTCQTTRFLLEHSNYDLTLIPVYGFHLHTIEGKEETFDCSIGSYIFLLNDQGKTIDKIVVKYEPPQK
jgi:hypothetical protein